MPEQTESVEVNLCPAAFGLFEHRLPEHILQCCCKFPLFFIGQQIPVNRCELVEREVQNQLILFLGDDVL